MFDIICDKNDNKGKNKLSNLCKELESCILKNTKFNPEYSFIDLYPLNDSIENIIIDFKNT